MTRLIVLLLSSLATTSAALRVHARGVTDTTCHSPSRGAATTPLRARRLVLQEDGSASKPAGATELTDQQIVDTANAASGDGVTSWPEVKPQPPTPTDTTVGPSEGFDPRIIAYVGLPALVLAGQLFFTFSRDALGETALGPAVMDFWIP